MYVLVFKQEKEEKGNVSKIFLIFWRVFFEEGIEKNFFVFSAFFLEKKVLIVLVRSGKGKNGSHKNEKKKIFSASRQKNDFI